MGVIDDVKTWANRQKAPVSVWLSVSLVAVAFYHWMTKLHGVGGLALTPDWSSHPWSLITYPWAYMPLLGPLGLLYMAFNIALIMWFGGTVEREMGSSRYAGLVAVMTLLAGVCTGLGGQVLNVDWAVAGPWLPSAAVAVVWCNRNMSAVMNLWGVLPISSRLLGWLVVGGVFLTYGQQQPLLGAFASAHLAAAWAFATNRLPFSYSGAAPRRRSKPQDTVMGGVKYDEAYYDDVIKRENERSERERLRKLFEGSLDEK